MAEYSILWTTTTSPAGDALVGYTENQVRKMFWALSGQGANTGVRSYFHNDLAVTGSSSPVSVAGGAAWVAGIFYWSDASVNVAVSTPVIGTTGHRVILRADWATKTVRIALKSSPDGTAALPALTQLVGGTYELPIAGVTIQTNGSISVVDERYFCTIPGKIKLGRTAAQVLGLVTAGDRLLRMPARQGGSTSVWSTAGTTNYDLSTVRVKVQAGVRQWSGSSGDTGGAVAVTFPEAFSQAPVIASLTKKDAVGNHAVTRIWPTSISTTGFTINWATNPGVSTIDFNWLAIGPA